MIVRAHTDWQEKYVNTITQGDCLGLMYELPDESVDCVVTSPPYDNLRDYNGYSFDFEDIAKELYRIIKEGGVVVWVVGDAVVGGSETGTSFKQALYFKDLGFNLHDTMIYEKAGGLPPNNRYQQCFEYMFILSKGAPKVINLLKDKKNRWAGSSTFGKSSFRNKDGSIKVSGKGIVRKYGYRTNIWRYANGYGFGQTDKIAYQHPATFPEKLAQDHIASWSNEQDIILDPLIGSGTTAIAAHKLNRNFIGFELSQEYVDIANKRLQAHTRQHNFLREAVNG